MSFDVNIGDYNVAIYEKLSGLQLLDGNGVLVDVPVIYQNPEDEFFTKILPSIVFFRCGFTPDPKRRTNDIFKESIDEYTVRVMPCLEPINIYYMIRYYYQYQTDGIILHKHIINKLGLKHSTLEIKGELYDLFYKSYNISGFQYKDYGELEVGEREFSEQFIYVLEGVIDLSDSAKIVPLNTEGVGVFVEVKEIK